HDGAVISLVVHPSDPLVVSSSVDRHIKLWNWEAGWRCVRKLKAHLNNVEKIWDVKTNTCIRQISGLQTDNSRCVGVVRPDCPLLVMTLQGNVTSLYNFDTDCYENSIDFKLGDVLNFAYAEGIKSVVIGFFGGIAMMKIN
uniref:Uncharacterized protein n=1 Tax=Triticum urartu TaxID=4572 RepID=A0A8R7VLH8_TRIUA